MIDTPTAGRNGDSDRPNGRVATGDAVSIWFVREILPLEAILMHYLHHNWRNAGDIADFRQEIYTRVFAAAQDGIPTNAKSFLLTTARNLLIDLVKHKRVVPIEVVADVEALNVAVDTAGPERTVISRDELRHLQAALDRLPARAREAFTLAFLEDLSAQEIAARMGVSRAMVSKHLASGLRTLTDMLYGEPIIRDRKSR
jgi:RNA polymerase sigma factor (sigma-70 family)